MHRSDGAVAARDGSGHGRSRWRRRVVLALVLAMAALSLTACLGPNDPDPTGTAPIGNLEQVVPWGDGFRAIGWVLDPDTTAPIQVSVISEQRKLVKVADSDRPDVAAAHGRGAAHGFDVHFTGLGPGPHQVCVWAENVGRGTEGRILGCTWVTVPDLSPTGNLEYVGVAAPGQARVAGWALDPESTGPVDVGVLLDGAHVAAQPAADPRPDVAQAFGLGAGHGFDISFPVTAGSHQVCVLASNLGSWGEARWLGCRQLDVTNPPDHRPGGGITSVQPNGSSVRVRGTATDPDGGPVQVRVAVGAASRVVTATGGAYDTTFTGVAVGTNQVCVTATDIPSASPYVISGDRAWPCGTAIVASGGGSVSVGSSGSPSGAPAPVGPAAGHPLRLIDRDAGISVELRDGSMLWLFGDSSEVNPANQLKYFVNNTAAWAPAGAPSVTQDAVVGGQPVQFASPNGSSWTCPADKPNKALWPLSAVRTASGSNDLVTAFMGNVCLGTGGLQIEARGVSVVQWTYNPSAPPSGQPITGTVVNHQLFDATAEYGTAAVVDGSTIYAYQCDRPADGPGIEWPNQFGPCHVARVPVSNVANRASWTFWTGSTWSSNITSAAPVIDRIGDDPKLPVSSMSVVYDAVHGVYVMAYSPWPGFTDRVFVRVATEPWGPWSDAVQITLPGCNDTVGTATYLCYAGTAQPQLSQPGLLGIGYYDQLVSVGPNRGQYVTITVPFTVVVVPI